MSDIPTLTLKADMPIQVGGDIGLRIQRGERIVTVRSVPLAMFDGWAERQCERNHQQTLTRIRERCGFGAGECVAVLACMSWADLGDAKEEVWHRILYAMIVRFNRGQRVAESRLAAPLDERAGEAK